MRALLLAATALALQKVPLRRQVTTTRRRLSVGGRTDLKTCDDNVFYAEASLGTPPQTFQLLIDTGSADLWVAATNCEDVQGGNGGCPTTNLYDFGASSTAKGFEGVRVAIDYVDGELARGPALSDTFTFGGVAVQNMEFVAADQADFWACGQEDGVLGFGPRGASRVAAALMTPGATPSNRLGAQLDATQVGIWLDDSQLGDAYAGEVALGGADEERFAGELAWLSRDDNAFWSAQSEEVTTLDGVQIKSGGNALFDTGTTQLLAPKGHVVATLAALADAICYAEDPDSPKRLCSAESDLAYEPCSTDDDCVGAGYAYGTGSCDAVPPLWIVKRCDALPEDGSETIDMAVADCDQGSRGLRFTFDGVSADLPANNLLSPQLHERRDFLDCDGVYWDRQYAAWSGDGQCDDGTYGPNFNCRAWDCDSDACDEPCDEFVKEDPPAKCWIDVGASTSGDWVLGDPFLRAFYLALDFDEDKVGVAPSYPLGSNPARIVRKGEDAPADEGEDATCRDDPAFFYGGDEDNDCAHVAAKPSRCDDSDNSDGERTAREACAKTCGTCPTEEATCADDASWFYDGDEDRDCEHVAANAGSRCDADNTNDEGVTALEACRVTCGTCMAATPVTEGPTPGEEAPEAQTPAPTPGPTYAPSSKPTSGASCVDDTTWYYDGNPDRDCAHVGEKPESRCDDDNANDDGVTALQACRVTCGTCPEANEETPAPTAAPSQRVATAAPTGACHDSIDWFYSGDDWKTCAYVGQELKRCKDSNVNDDGISALEACPVTCDTCDAAPSSKPTAAPVFLPVTGDDQFDDDDEPTGSPVADDCVDSLEWYLYIGNELQTCGAVAGNPDLCKVGDTAENCRKSCGTCGVFVETPRPSLSPSPAPTEDFEASGRDRSVSARGLPAMGWLLVFVVVGSVAAAVMCLVCRKRRSSARLNSEDHWQAQWSQVSSTTPAGGAVELHQVGVRNPMADDREKGFSDVNLGV